MRHTDYDPLYSVYFAPRGYARMVQLGRSIAHRHLTALDNLIGVIGDAGSGKPADPRHVPGDGADQ